MFPANLSLTFTVFFILSFFHGDLFINAIPTKSSSVLPRMARILIGPESYELEELSTQGFFSRAYEVVGGYEGFPSILKIVAGGADRMKTQTELDNLDTVGLYLWAQSNTKLSFFVMKDVRKDYPHAGDVKKLFSDWYFEDENMDVVQSLATLQARVHEVLMDYARDENIGLMHHDCHLNNIYTDNTFTDIMPVDWAPSDSAAGMNGVVPINEDYREEHLQVYYNWLVQNLPGMYSLQALSNILTAGGKQLRLADAQLLAGRNTQK